MSTREREQVVCFVFITRSTDECTHQLQSRESQFMTVFGDLAKAPAKMMQIRKRFKGQSLSLDVQ